MSSFVAVTSCPTGVAHTLMAAEALKKAAAQAGHAIKVETGPSSALTAEEIARADLVILAIDVQVDRSRFADKLIYETRTSEAIRHTSQVLQAALSLLPAPPAPAIEVPPASKKLVGITSCPTGIAHTFMAANALEKAARVLGHSIKIETQGSVGAKNVLTPEEIADADAVLIAADTKVELSRFIGKPLYATSTKHAIHHGQDAIRASFDAPAFSSSASTATAAPTKKDRTGPYKHLMTGVSYMLPLVIAGGLAIAIAFAIGGIQAGDDPSTLAGALNTIGARAAFSLFIAVLSGFIAYSIADRPGIAPGLVGGLLAQNMGAGFIGGIVAGFLAGYLTKFLADKIKLPKTLEGLKPVLILPFLSTVIVGLLMIFVIAPPVGALNTAMNAWLNGMRGANALLLGALLGGMMAVDMGGPINKAAYTFAVGLLASKVYGPMAAVMAGGMTPALGVGLAATFFKSRFSAEDRDARGPALVLGLSFVTEGAIPFAAKDPLRVIPALVVGSAVAGAISMVASVQLLVPHGGVFAALIPGAVSPLGAYLLAIVAGSVVSALLLFALKKPVRT